MASGTIGTAYIQIAPNLSGVQGKITAGLKGSGSAFAGQFSSEISSKSAVLIGAISGFVQAGVQKALSVVSDSVDAAVKRVDTLNSAQKTFEYMGFAAADSAVATKTLTKSIQGLPTPLDSAVRGMTSLAATYGDVKLGQKVFTALNDAILGFGGSAAMVDNAIQQISQLPLDGPLDAQTWMSLRNSGLTPVLVAMGKDMGKSVSQLKEDFGSGKLTVQDFVNELTKLDTEGGGGLVSLQKIAQNATSGIGTGFSNMQTAVSRGLANIIQAVGQKNISTFISNIGTAFETTLNAVAKAIPIAVSRIKELVDFVVKYKDLFGPLAVGAAAAVAAMVTFGAVMKVVAVVTAMQKALVGAQTAMALYTSAVGQGIPKIIAFNAAFNVNPIFLAITAIAAIVAGLVYFFTQTETGKKIIGEFGKFLGDVWKGIQAGLGTIGTFFSDVWKNITGAVTTAMSAIASFWNTTLKPVFDTIGAILGVILGLFIKVFAAIALVVLGTISIIVQVIAGAMMAIWNVISPIWNAIYGVISAVLGWIWDRIVVAFNFYIGIITTVMAAIWNVITSVWNAIYGFVAPIVTNIANFVGGVFTTVWKTVSSIWNSIFGTISGALGQIWSSVTGVFNNVVNFVAGIGGKILGALGNLGGLLYNSGKDLINGLLNGAGSLLSSIGKFFLDKLPGWIQGPFKSALGIHSPSTVFAGYGKNIDEGLALGVDKHSDMVKSSVNSMATDAMAGMTGVNNSLAAGFDSSVSASQNVQAGQYQAAPAVNQYITATIKNDVDIEKVGNKLGFAVSQA